MTSQAFCNRHSTAMAYNHAVQRTGRCCSAWLVADACGFNSCWTCLLFTRCQRLWLEKPRTPVVWYHSGIAPLRMARYTTGFDYRITQWNVFSVWFVSLSRSFWLLTVTFYEPQSMSLIINVNCKVLTQTHICSFCCACVQFWVKRFHGLFLYSSPQPATQSLGRPRHLISCVK